MAGTASRWRRSRRGVLALLAAGLAVQAPTASASVFDTDNDVIAYGGASEWFSGTSNVIKWGDRSITAYWSDRGVLTVAGYDHSTQRVTTYPQSGETIANPHDWTNTIAIGKSPNDGRVHISYTDSVGRHRYLISDRNDYSRYTANPYQVDRTAETSLTAGVYFNDRRGNLYFSWRTGFDPANGDQMLNSYNDDGRWTHRGVILKGTNGTRYTYDPDGAGPASSITTSQRSPYVAGFEFDSGDVLHMLWTWRERTSATDGSQHGLYYATSRDRGVNWYDNSGTWVGITSSNPISLADRAPTQVLAEVPGWFTTSSNLDLDSTDNPHMVSAASDTQESDRFYSNNRQAHYWRRSDGTWHAGWVEEREDGTTEPVAGELLIENDDDARVIFARNAYGWKPWNSDPVTQAELPRRNIVGGYGLMTVELASSATVLQTIDPVGVAIDTSDVAEVNVLMRNDTSARDVNIYWTTNADPTWSASKGQTFRGVLNQNDPNYTEYRFTITDADWNGTLRGLEFHPAVGANRGRVVIDRISIRRRGTNIPVARWGFDVPQKLYTAEAEQEVNWEDWTIEEYAIGGAGADFGDTGWHIDHETNDGTSSRVVFPVLFAGRNLDFLEARVQSWEVSREWYFDHSAIGWRSRDVSGLRIAADGARTVLWGRLTTGSPEISIDNLRIQSTAVDINLEGMGGDRNLEGTGVTAVVQTDDGRTFTARDAVGLPGGRYGTATANIKLVERWAAPLTIKKITLRFSGERFHLDHLWVHRLWID